MIIRTVLMLAIFAALAGTAYADVPPEPEAKGGISLAFWIAIATAIGLAIFTAIRSQNKNK